jgi:diguanylate cyclase (GGDEF)-like protein/PAS domain S-box-containing protein
MLDGSNYTLQSKGCPPGKVWVIPTNGGRLAVVTKFVTKKDKADEFPYNLISTNESANVELLKRKPAHNEIFSNDKRTSQELQQALKFAQGIVATAREPLLVLDASLKIVAANDSFHKLFSVKPQETEGKLVFEIGNNQWDIPPLREMLQEILPRNTSFNDFEVEHDFPQIGRRTMILNARRIHDGEFKTSRILLAIEDITERKLIEQEKASSELRYRRLFETAQDGILILNAETGQITDVNPFLIDMLGYSKNEFLGKRLWEFGAFIDARKSREAYKELLMNNYIRYEDLPLQTKNGERREVEFVSNAYLVNTEKVIQCNIRDISERKRLERNLEYAATHDFLTGLPNRSFFNEHYILALAGAKRYLYKLAIMVLDIDHFKDINDAMGHNCGDQLLKEFGNRLSNIVRKTDTVSRMGGDEFVLLLTEVTDTENISSSALKILEHIRKPFMLNKQEVRVTTSIGISDYPTDGEDIEMLIKYADAAMYQAKNKGRNKYLRYKPGMS